MNCFDHFESSLTKGCFVHKPNKSKKKKITKLQGSNNNWLKEFKQSWSEIEKKIQEIENSSYEKTFDAVAKFVDASIQFPLEHMDEIPAAVLQMGVNMPDHNNILKCLEKTLRSKKNYTALLEPRKCHNFSSIVQCLDNVLQNQLCEVSGNQSLDTLFSSDALVRFIGVKSSSKKQARSAKNGHIKPLVLIIQDVETFDLELLEELILNCKIYMGKLPIVLIFGMSSAMVTLQNILPQRVLCHLGIETFYSFAAAEYLTRIIEEVVVSPQYPFKLGPKVFRLVVDTVLYHDFSVTNLKHLLHFSLLKHFYKNKGAVLLCSERDIEKKITNLKNEELQHLRKLPSLQQYRENNPEITTDFNSASDFKLLLTVLMENMFTFQNSVIISLKVLHYLTKELPGSPLGKQFREIYLLNLEKQLYSSACFKEAEKLLKFQSHNELLSKLKVCLDFLKSSDPSLAEDLMSVVEASIRQLTELTSEDFDKKLNSFNIENEKFSSRFELQEKMRSNIKLRRSKFEAVRNEVIENILFHFKNIHSPILLPLHEIFFFDEAYSCKKHLMPSPRVVLCSALTNPHHYLECKCCKIVESAGGEIPSSMPDLSALYKLHLECGKLINLCDWLEAFKSIKSKEFKSKKRGTSKLKTDESKLNIRFLHSATELQLLGFVKPTKRKTDHVARLTFGTF